MSLCRSYRYAVRGCSSRLSRTSGGLDLDGLILHTAPARRACRILSRPHIALRQTPRQDREAASMPSLITAVHKDAGCASFPGSAVHQRILPSASPGTLTKPVDTVDDYHANPQRHEGFHTVPALTPDLLEPQSAHRLREEILAERPQVVQDLETAVDQCRRRSGLSSRCPAGLPASQDRRKGSKRFIDRRRVGEHVQKIRVDHDYVRAFCVAGRRDPPDGLARSVAGSHCNASPGIYSTACSRMCC